MLFGSLSEHNGGLSLDNFTVSSSEIIIRRAIRLFPDISGNSIVRYWLANYSTENAESWVARREFEALDGEIHFESTKCYRKNRCKSMK